jgi:hypothetical protein
VNPAVTPLYTYEMDLCFLLALAAKLAFPWLYTFFTGHSCKCQLNFLTECLYVTKRPLSLELINVSLMTYSANIFMVLNLFVGKFRGFSQLSIGSKRKKNITVRNMC